MKIGVISDTHDQRDNTLKAVKIFNQEKVELVIHCGDWISPFSVDYFKDLCCPVKGIFGNNDGDRFRHITRSVEIKANVTYSEYFLNLVLDKRKIAVYHGEAEEIVEALVTCGKYAAVFHGHTHEKANQPVGKTLSLNPGTMLDYTLPGTTGASFAIYDTRTNTARLIEL